MQKKYWIIPVIITAILVASLFAFSNPKTAEPRSRPICCKKPVKKCPSIKETPAPAQTSLDDLSNQFIAFPLYNY